MTAGARAVTLRRMSSTPATSTELPGLVLTPMGGLRRSGPLTLRARTTLITPVGGRDVERVREVPADAPVIRLRSFALIGGLRVRVGTA
jgi:hypothetical protein